MRWGERVAWIVVGVLIALMIKCGGKDENGTPIQIKGDTVFAKPEAIHDTTVTTEFLWKVIHRNDTIIKEIEKFLPIVLSRADSDSIFSYYIRHRTYRLNFGDTILKGVANLQVTGELDTAQFEWTLNIPQKKDRNMLSCLVTLGTDTTLSAGILFQNRKKFGYGISYDLWRKSVNGTVTIPIIK